MKICCMHAYNNSNDGNIYDQKPNPPLIRPGPFNSLSLNVLRLLTLVTPKINLLLYYV